MQAWLPAIRLRISYGFWIMALLPGVTRGVMGMALWGAIIFSSVVLHQLGHALPGLSSGRRAVIVLHSLGSRTEFEPRLPARQSVWSAAAGPLLSLLMGALLVIARRLLPAAPYWLTTAMWVNLGWGTLNVLPIIPFDGGRFLMDRLGKRHASTALLISAATTAAISTACVLTIRNIEFAILLASVNVLSIFQLGSVHDQVSQQVLDAQLGEARLAVVQHQYADAIRVSEAVLGRARDFGTRNAALTMLAWACLGEGRPRAAMTALGKVMPRQAVDPYTLAAVERASGQRDEAIQTLERTRSAASLSREAARLLVDLYAERGDLERAFATTLDHLTVLGPDDARLVVRALEQAEDFRHAATLSLAIGAKGRPAA